jgi:hypothetical protein
MRNVCHTTVAAVLALSAITGNGRAQSQPQVLLGGIGTPRDMVPMVLEDLTDFLKSKKVAAKQISGELKTRDEYLAMLEPAGAKTLLYVSLRAEAPGVKADLGGFLKVQAFDVKGNSLWEEKISRMTSGSIKDMINQMEKRKLPKHIGEAELPIQ